jgi:predicted ATP-grasp superfamily ATP-dependent carboligase
MTVEYNQSLLASISSQNPDVNAAIQYVNQYTEMFKAGQISKEEYVQLVEDVQRTVNIRGQMAELEAMQKLNTAINGLLSLASII